MKPKIVHNSEPILLVGGGKCHDRRLRAALTRVGAAVAADGGAAHLIEFDRIPDAVFGDMDSLSPQLAARIPEDRLFPIAEQDSTDFAKALRQVEAPLILAHGFTGLRLDHTLAVLTVLAHYPDRRCIVVGEEDVVLLCPPRITLDLATGTRVSLWPLGPVQGRSTGLRWPIDGIEMTPDGRVGTSNAAEGSVTLEIDAPLMLLILPVSCQDVLEAALDRAGRWPARAE